MGNAKTQNNTKTTLLFLFYIEVLVSSGNNKSSTFQNTEKRVENLITWITNEVTVFYVDQLKHF